MSHRAANTILNGFDSFRYEFKTITRQARLRFEEREFEHERKNGHGAVTHQRFVGAGYFDQILSLTLAGANETEAMTGSTEEEQFAGETG